VSVVIQEMTKQDYDEVLALWQASKGIGLSDADSEEGIARFLDRNPGLSFTAREKDRLVGAILCGHDGRRGYIYHLAVSKTHRRKGVGRELVARCLSALKAAGIQKCHLFIFTDNPGAIAFWKAIGWTQRIDLLIMSRYTEDAASPSFGDHSRL
jgi:ribosomal protein S18 acetylase RimI-like enzyme